MPAALRIVQKIKVDGKDQEYTSNYQNVFPNAQYSVYKLNDFDTNTGKPKSGVKPIMPTKGFAKDSFYIDISNIARGDYVVVQENKPEHTDELTPNWQKATVTGGQSSTVVTFVNQAEPKQGILLLKKINSAGNPLKDAGFTLFSKPDGNQVGEEVKSDGAGQLILYAKAGEYTLRETTVPEGKVRMAEKTVTLKAGEINRDYFDNPITNVDNTVSLTINKYVVQHVNPANHTPVNKPQQPNARKFAGANSISFTLERTLDKPSDANAKWETIDSAIVLAKDASAVTLNTETTPEFKRADENGAYYSYRLTENAPDADAAFLRDPYTHSWTFTDKVSSYTAEFYNKFTGKIMLAKKEITLDEATGKQVVKPRANAKFELYQKKADGNFVKLADLTSDKDGIILSNRLPAFDENGKPANYYVKEDATALSGYVLTDQRGSEPKEKPYFGPFAVNTSSDVTDYTKANPLQNREDVGMLSVSKVSEKNRAVKLADAQFKVYYLENNTKVYLKDQQGSEVFTTKANADTLIKVANGVDYHIEEIKAPDGYMLNTAEVIAKVDKKPLFVKAAQIVDKPLPTIRGQKFAKQTETGKIITGVQETKDVEFALYIKKGADFVPALDKNGDPITLVTGSDGYTQTVTISDYQSEYYVKESKIGDQFVRPGQKGYITQNAFNMNGAKNNLIEHNGEYFGGPIDFSKGGNFAFGWTNMLNRGTLTLVKQDIKTGEEIPGFEAMVLINTGDPVVTAQLEKLGFVKDGTAYKKTLSTDKSSVGVSGLPLLDSKGNELKYRFIETKAPEGYHLNKAYTKDSDPTVPDLNKAETAAFNIAEEKGGAFTGIFKDPKNVSYEFRKYGFSEYDDKNASLRLLYTLTGAKFAIYRIDENGILRFIEEKAGDGADFTFANLYANEEYAVIETVVPVGYRIVESHDEYGHPIPRSVLSPANGLDGKNRSELSKYNCLTYNFADSEDNDDYKAKLGEANSIANGEPYWQINVTKQDLKGHNLNLGRFDLYEMEKSAWETAGQPALPPQGSVPVQKNLESGMLADGQFTTKRLSAGKVYWLKETLPPPTYQIINEWNGPFIYTDKDLNSTRRIVIQNKPITPGGSGVPQALQLKLRKVLFSMNAKTGEEKYEDLAGARFEVWLTDSSFTDKILKLVDMESGVDRSKVALRGTAISEHLIIDDAFIKAHKCENFITKNEDGSYTFNILLIETGHPFKTTPRNGGVYRYTYTTKPLSLSMSHLNTHFYGNTENSPNNIVNDGDLSYLVKIVKQGYNAKDGLAKAQPLEGAEIGLYEKKDGKLITQETTNRNGEARFYVRITKDYEVKEISAPEGYELSDQVYEFEKRPDVPNPLPEPYVINDLALRKLTIVKKDADGNSVQDANFTVSNQNGTPLLDGNQNDRPDDYGRLTTGADGKTPALLLRGEGTYKVSEDSVSGKALSAREQEYFLLANRNARSFGFGKTEAEKTMEVVNPGLGRLTITKKDTYGATMANVAFSLKWKPFKLASGFNKPQGAYGNPEGMNAPLEGKTGSDGKLTLDNLVPGWYEVTETVPEGYIAVKHVFEIPVYGKALGGDKTGNNALEVTNIPLAPLTIKKQFKRLDTEPFPASQTFSIYTDDKGTRAATVYLDKKGTKNSNNTVKAAIDEKTGLGEITVWLPINQDGKQPDTSYYIDERDDEIFVNRTEGLNASGLLQATLNKDSIKTPVEKQFTNVSRWGKIEVVKQDTEGKALEGAEFYLYDSAAKKYYHEDAQGNGTWQVAQAGAKAWTSDSKGKMSLRVLLPNDGKPNHALKLEEITLPSGYVLPAEPKDNLQIEAKDQQTVQKTVLNERGVTINLRKHSRPKHYVTDDKPYYLENAKFELYMVKDGQAVKVRDAQATNAQGVVTFDNLPKLDEGWQYAIFEKEAEGYLPQLTETWVKGSAADAVDATVQGGVKLYRLFKVAQREDEVVAEVYNTPAGTLYLFKYDIENPTLPPEGLTFAVTKDGDASFKGEGLVGKAGDHFPSLLIVDGKTYTLNAKREYDGQYGKTYTVAMLDGLAPGVYTITEKLDDSAFYTKYFYPDGTKNSDEWYRTRTVEIKDDGTVAAAVFGNLPHHGVGKPEIRKAADKKELDSLITGKRTIQYTLSGYPLKDKQYRIPLNSVTVTDPRPVFTDAQNVPVTKGVRYEVRGVTIEKAGYQNSRLIKPKDPSKEPIMAALYGILAGGAEKLIGTYDVHEKNQTVTIDAKAAEQYEGIKVVYTGANGAALYDGFTAGNIIIKAALQQKSEATMGEVAEVTNKTNVSINYSLIPGKTGTGENSATVSTPVNPMVIAPRASIAKSGVLIVDGREYKVGAGEQYKNITPGSTIKYTITVKNVSQEDAAIVDPTVLDVLPDMFEPDMRGIVADAPGLTLSDTCRQDNRIHLDFDGNFNKGATISVTIPGLVKTTAFGSAGSALINKAYFLSRQRASITKDNPNGSSFRNEKGALPAEKVAAADIGLSGDDYSAIAARHEFPFVTATNVKIYKIGKGDIGTEFVGDESFTVANPTTDKGTGTIEYQIAVVNKGDNPLKDLRIIDVLPHVGDKGVQYGDARLSGWEATLAGVEASGATVYTSVNQTPSKNDLTADRISTDWKAGVTAGAKSVLITVNSDVAPGATFKFKIKAKAPKMGPDAEAAYFLQSNNNATMAYNHNPITCSTSNIVKVTLVPAVTDVGDRVWVDLNGNGLQDDEEPDYLEKGLTMTLRAYENGQPLDAAAKAVAGGKYIFTDLVTGAPKENAGSALYDSKGNVDQTMLLGAMRRTYILQAEGVADGFLPSPAFVGSKTGDAMRNAGNDSNFRMQNGGLQSEIFYLTTKQPDMRKDLGLVPVRNLKLTKTVDTYDLPLKDTVFGVYGPFDELDGAELTAANRVCELKTDENGVAEFTSTQGTMLLRAKHYVAVEENSGNKYAHTEGLTVEGNGVVPAKDFKPTGDMIKDGNYFGLTKGTKDAPGDILAEIQVTDRYAANGQLTLAAKKTLLGRALADDDFTFEITSSDHPGFKPITAKNKQDGSITFAPIAYTEKDIDKTYHYALREIKGAEEGMAYDGDVQIFSVTVTDAGKDDLARLGELNAAVKVNEKLVGTNAGPTLLHTFANRKSGDLAITKIVKGNGGEDDKAFNFTVTLDYLKDVETETVKAINNQGQVEGVEFKNGEAHISLKHNQTLTLKDILADATYQVVEDDYLQDGYTTTKTNDQGQITGKGAACEFINERVLRGDLIVKKTIDGNGATQYGREDKAYEFTVTFTPYTNFVGTYNADGDYTATRTDKDGNTTTETLTVTGNIATFTLKHDESLSISGLYQRMKAKVSENDYLSDAYITTGNDQEVTIGEQPQTVTVQNTRNIGSLMVQKAVEGNGADKEDAFTFVITLKTPDGVAVDRKYSTVDA